MTDEAKVSHALHLVSRLEMMRDNELVCDFTIIVAGKSYPVHRTVLVAASDYFKGMFLSNMKEVQQGFVQIEGLQTHAFEKCLDFMYTGSIVLIMESIEHILHIAELFQLTGLKDLCMANNLSSSNCLLVINLADTYNQTDAKEEAEHIVVDHLKEVISSQMFPSISRNDLLRYISQADFETKWKAVSVWAKGRDDLPQLIEMIGIDNFPFQFLLEDVLKDPLVQESDKAEKFVIGCLFSNAKALEEGIDVANCIFLKILSMNGSVEAAISDIINKFLEENFQEIAEMEEFCNLSESAILDLFKSSNLHYHSEIVKWEAAVMWVQHDLWNRKRVFQSLFETISLASLPAIFLRDTVREESLVNG